MARDQTHSQNSRRRGGGFSAAGQLVQSRVQAAGRKRGFAVARVLTHWTEVVGPEIAALCQPVKVAYGRGGLGATLTVLARGASGPMVQAQLSVIRDRVNACYGYNAVSKVRITQTAPGGFGEAKSPFGPAPFDPAPTAPQPPDDAAARRAEDTFARDVTDPGLRAALAGLGARIITRQTK